MDVEPPESEIPVTPPITVLSLDISADPKFDGTEHAFNKRIRKLGTVLEAFVKGKLVIVCLQGIKNVAGMQNQAGELDIRRISSYFQSVLQLQSEVFINSPLENENQECVMTLYDPQCFLRTKSAAHWPGSHDAPLSTSNMNGIIGQTEFMCIPEAYIGQNGGFATYMEFSVFNCKFWPNPVDQELFKLKLMQCMTDYKAPIIVAGNLATFPSTEYASARDILNSAVELTMDAKPRFVPFTPAPSTSTHQPLLHPQVDHILLTQHQWFIPNSVKLCVHEWDKNDRLSEHSLIIATFCIFHE